MALAGSGEGFARVTLEDSGGRVEPGTDLAHLADGYACVTPVHTLLEAREFEFEPVRV
jgi:5'/3'-nucleotidase